MVTSKSDGLMVCALASVYWSHRVQQQQGTGKVRIIKVVKRSEIQYLALTAVYSYSQAAGHAGQMLSCHNAASKHAIATNDTQDICLQKGGKVFSCRIQNNAILSVQYVILSDVFRHT